MKSNQLTDKHLRALSLLSNCKWPTSSSTFSLRSPCCCCSSSLLLSLSFSLSLSLCKIPLPPPSCEIAINFSWVLVRSAWLEVIYKPKSYDVLKSQACPRCCHIYFLELKWLCRPYTGIMVALFSSIPPPLSPMCEPLSFRHNACRVCTQTCMSRWPPLTLLHESHVLWSGQQICATTEHPPPTHPVVKLKAWCLAAVLPVGLESELCSIQAKLDLHLSSLLQKLLVCFSLM